MLRCCLTLLSAVALAGCLTPVPRPVVAPVQSAVTEIRPPAPGPGDAATYRVLNGYNSEEAGRVEHRVERRDGELVYVTVAPTTAYAGFPHTEIRTAEGNALRRVVTNHDQPVEYAFDQPLVSYPFPLDIGKSWSARAAATAPATGRRTSIRVDGIVQSAERIRTPAGEFDTLRIARRVYAGDADFFRGETHITETEWYAPSLGRPVRVESTSRWWDSSLCSRANCDWARGEWTVLELLGGNILPKR